MKYITTSLFAALLLHSSAIIAQVPVREEPLHRKLLENQYIRFLDVWMRPGDTSLFHIHATPSLFLHFTNTQVAVQIKGAAWNASRNKKGDASYRSFINDTLVHRVSNIDTALFHVTDIELLSPYKPATQLKPLPFTVLFENEKAVAYRLSHSSFSNQIISGRGPIIAELVAGDEVICHDAVNKRSATIKNGRYFYIEPGNSFYFSAKENKEINLVLFEIK